MSDVKKDQEQTGQPERDLKNQYLPRTSTKEERVAEALRRLRTENW